MKKALIVGIDNYDDPKIKDLKGCVNDANVLANLLKWNHSKPPEHFVNFNEVDKLCSDEVRIERTPLKKKIRHFFEDTETELALFYFSGHGDRDEKLGGYLATQDTADLEEGISSNDLMKYVNSSTIKEIILILDCCFSGYLGSSAFSNGFLGHLRQGVSIITASHFNQYAVEINGRGLFSKYLCKALEGQKADLLGNVKITDVYEYVDMMLSLFEEQQPLFRLNVSRSRVIRVAEASITLKVLRKITSYFKGEDYRFKLNPSFIREGVKRIEKNEESFADLLAMENCGLITSKRGERLYFVASNYKYCKLTQKGKLYWNRVKNNAI